jgi:hypothetical protein
VRYRHTQFGWVTLGATLVILPVVVAGLLHSDLTTLMFVVAIIALMATLFGWLTVDIDDRRLLLKMGIGLIRRTIPLNAIRSFAPVTNRWIYGWGVRFTPYGMLYNVSGLRAVEILFDNGRRVRIGTDEPEALVRALSDATRKAAVASPAEFPKDAGWPNRVRMIFIGLSVLVAAWVAWNFYAYTKPPSIELSNFTFRVGTGLHGADLALADIESVTLVDNLPRILRRTNGFSSGGLLRGNFLLEEWGRGELFINRNSPPYLVVRSRDTFLVVNFEGADRTRELYRQLISLTGRDKTGGQIP